MIDEWITKMGAVGRPLLLGIQINDELATFADLDTPQLRMRRSTAAQDTALAFTVTSYTDTENVPVRFNAQVVFDDAAWDLLEPGHYIADIAAMIDGELTFWPDGSYIRIRILRGISDE